MLADPLFRFVAFVFLDKYRWFPWPRFQTRELQAYPHLIHIGGKSDHLLKNVTDLRLSNTPTPITSVICMYLFYFEWFFGGFLRPFTPDRPWLWLVMILYSVLLWTRAGSPRCIQVTFANEPGQEQTAHLFPLNHTATRRDPALERFLEELRQAVLPDSPGPEFPHRSPPD